MKRRLLLDALRNYLSEYPEERASVTEIINFIQGNPDCFERTNLYGHITGSAWLLNQTQDKVLLTHHKKLNKWLQLGGHSDGDGDTRNVALREATEESGITGITFISPNIFDVDVHIIPANPIKHTPQHYHFDIRFLLCAPHENFIVSEESFALKWASLADLENMKTTGKIADGMLRMIKKWQKILSYN